jgi:hypothetical protein
VARSQRKPECGRGEFIAGAGTGWPAALEHAVGQRNERMTRGDPKVGGGMHTTGCMSRWHALVRVVVSQRGEYDTRRPES